MTPEIIYECRCGKLWSDSCQPLKLCYDCETYVLDRGRTKPKQSGPPVTIHCPCGAVASLVVNGAQGSALCGVCQNKLREAKAVNKDKVYIVSGRLPEGLTPKHVIGLEAAESEAARVSIKYGTEATIFAPLKACTPLEPQIQVEWKDLT
jgi:hypothetical protein